MANKIRNFSLTLFEYKRRFIISLSIFSAFIFVLIWMLVFGVSNAVKTLEKLKEIVETSFLGSEELLQFKNANIFIIKPKMMQNYIIEAQVKENISTKISLKGGQYSMRNLDADIFLVNVGTPKESWIEKYLLTSKIVSIADNTVILEGDIEIHFSSKQNQDLNGTIAHSNKITFLIKENMGYGNKIFIKNPTSTFNADKFEVFLNQDLAKFSQNVLYDNLDYKIKSKTLEAIFYGGQVQTLTFKGKVQFNEKHGNKTTAYGETAIFQALTSEIIITDNVIINTEKNNLQIKADSFIYNEKTKKGTFKTNSSRTTRNSSGRVEIELDI